MSTIGRKDRIGKILRPREARKDLEGPGRNLLVWKLWGGIMGSPSSYQSSLTLKNTVTDPQLREGGPELWSTAHITTISCLMLPVTKTLSDASQ